jgi:hypothetical protein
MPVVTSDGLSFSGLAWTFKFLTSKHTENQHMTCYVIHHYILDAIVLSLRLVKVTEDIFMFKNII